MVLRGHQPRREWVPPIALIVHCLLTQRCRDVVLDNFYRELLAEAGNGQTQTTPPQQDIDERSTSSANAEGPRSPERVAKRAYETESPLLSPHKRSRQEDERKVMELLESSG